MSTTRTLRLATAEANRPPWNPVAIVVMTDAMAQWARDSLPALEEGAVVDVYTLAQVAEGSMRGKRYCMVLPDHGVYEYFSRRLQELQDFANMAGVGIDLRSQIRHCDQLASIKGTL